MTDSVTDKLLHSPPLLLKGGHFLIAVIQLLLWVPSYLMFEFLTYLVSLDKTSLNRVIQFLIFIPLVVLSLPFTFFALGALALSSVAALAFALLLVPVYWLASFFADVDILLRSNTDGRISSTEVIRTFVYNVFCTPFVMLYRCVVYVIPQACGLFMEMLKDVHAIVSSENIFKSFLDEESFKKKCIKPTSVPRNIAYPHIMLSLTSLLSVTVLVLILEGFFPASILPLGVVADAIAGLSTPALAGCAAGTVLLLGLLITFIVVTFNKPYWPKEDLDRSVETSSAGGGRQIKDRRELGREPSTTGQGNVRHPERPYSPLQLR